MVLLGLLQAGGSVLGQAMEQVTGGNLLSMLLVACAFTLSLVYLLRLAIGHLAPLPAGSALVVALMAVAGVGAVALAMSVSPPGEGPGGNAVGTFDPGGHHPGDDPCVVPCLMGCGIAPNVIYISMKGDMFSLKSPPYIFSPIPFLGHAIAFGNSPIEFLENAYEKYGPVFSFTMVGKTFTYLLGSEAAALLFNSKNEDLNAEDVYSRLTTPVFGKGVAYDVPNPLKDLNLLDRCIKETLRLRPPIMTMMRLAKTPQTVAGYIIPPGHQVCVSPTVNQRLKDSWVERLDFNPDRYLQDNPASGEKFAYVPFGAGRHRCIGENFAYVQIKTIWSTMLRLYEFDLIDGYFPTVNYTTMIHTPENPVIRYKRRSK
ncbi:hypothetical protein CB1_000326003 [Camelus ferus]|nr:hypothetical protein CB1_000326003 [Camelus ferus]